MTVRRSAWLADFCASACVGASRRFAHPGQDPQRSRPQQEATPAPDRAAPSSATARPAGAGSRILQTEYSTWVVQDQHARATEVLDNAVSLRMGRSSGSAARQRAEVPARATRSTCRRSSARRPYATEGVSCEACHGPATGWLGPIRRAMDARAVGRGRHVRHERSRRAAPTSARRATSAVRRSSSITR